MTARAVTSKTVLRGWGRGKTGESDGVTAVFLL